ncbi:MAG: peptidylprolyl isomerase [Clostridia bacterium]|nr:peptidylprolyl isomerase [Clostridia bacterium]
MKRIKNITALLLIAVMLITMLSGCVGKKYALKVGDIEISQDQYKAAAISIKTQFFNENGLEETEDEWTKPISTNDSTTLEEYLNAMIQSYLIEYTLYAIHFDELGLTLTQEETDKIEKDVQAVIDLAGSKEKLIETLDKQGLTYDEYVENYYNEAKKARVIRHYFGPESEINPTSHEEMEKYYNEYYTKVKHVFLSTKDSETNDLSNAQKEEIKSKAERILKKAQAGEDFDSLIEQYNEDPGVASSPDGYVFSKDDTSYNRLFYKAAFDMEFDEIRLVQTNLGFHIMKRYAFFNEDLTDPDTELTLIENMMSSEVAEILEDLKEKIGVEYNNEVLEKLSAPYVHAPETEQTTEE